jgi:hypothetical protein
VHWHFATVRHGFFFLDGDQDSADILIARRPSSVIRTTATSIGSRPAIIQRL